MYVTYPAIFYREENGEYSIFFPGFDGGTCGSSLEECYKMAVDWLGIQLEDYYLKKSPLPKPIDITKINIKNYLDFDTEEEKEEAVKNCFVTLIGFDLLQYIKDTQKTIVRKNVSVPSWLNELGKSYNLNFSLLLQEAIKKELGIED